MKALAADAKSLKNALTNVKERGTYGEVRLEKLLSDILAPSQYEMNVKFAINLPQYSVDENQGSISNWTLFLKKGVDSPLSCNDIYKCTKRFESFTGPSVV